MNELRCFHIFMSEVFSQKQPELMGDSKHLIEYGKDAMNVDADKWMALQAIHSAVHAA